MIFSYNPEAVGDVLFVIVADAQGKKVRVERKNKVARIFLEDSQETVGWNVFDCTKLIGKIAGIGQVHLTANQQKKLNNQLHEEGFTETLVDDAAPKFIIGFVKSCKKHPDSTHLSITQTEIDNGQVVQIVCGAANIKAGLKVVVAKVGAMLPNGLIIWPGMLRGVESSGMICSAKELALPNAPVKKGILELPFDSEVGQPFFK